MLLSLLAQLALLLGSVEASTNFTQCYSDFKDNETNVRLYGYRGPLYDHSISNNASLISLGGCETLCGTGPDYYGWKISSSTITTWVMPVIGLLLQAPFESNAKKRTFLAIVRWLGSPIASLTYMLWNVRVNAKSATMVDMSVPFGEYPGENTDFYDVRDGFCILSFMNQYTIHPGLDPAASEKLIRLALFGYEMKMVDGGPSLVQRRRELATFLRDGRRRGVVPVYITLMWFIFSLTITLVDSFDRNNLGNNTLAHDLALGLLLAWLPVLVLTGIVDRNPIAIDETRRRLNGFVGATHHARCLPFDHGTVVRQGGDWPAHQTSWLLKVDDRFDDIFQEFAGQGRVRMHLGIAQSVLSNVELSYVGQQGRDWLHDEGKARDALVHGRVNPNRPYYFDPRALWEILASIILVDGTIAGAFIISYLTPTVGLGCRSGGYMIFIVLTGALATAEFLVWLTTSPTSSIRRTVNRFFPVFELISAGWLFYIVMAQILGSYQTCVCMASVWAGKGGYVILDSSAVGDSPEVLRYWGAGVVVSCAIMGGAFAFIVVEWCEQSHLYTENYSNAKRGLRRTRRWKRCTMHSRTIFDRIIKLIKWALGRHQRRSLIWTVHRRRKMPAQPPYRTPSRQPSDLASDDGPYVLSPMVSPALA